MDPRSRITQRKTFLMDITVSNLTFYIVIEVANHETQG